MYPNKSRRWFLEIILLLQVLQTSSRHHRPCLRPYQCQVDSIVSHQPLKTSPSVGTCQSSRSVALVKRILALGTRMGTTLFHHVQRYCCLGVCWRRRSFVGACAVLLEIKSLPYVWKKHLHRLKSSKCSREADLNIIHWCEFLQQVVRIFSLLLRSYLIGQIFLATTIN